MKKKEYRLLLKLNNVDKLLAEYASKKDTEAINVQKILKTLHKIFLEREKRIMSWKSSKGRRNTMSSISQGELL